MAKADASRGRIIFKAESAFAETPASNPATTRMRFTGESLKHENVDVISDEVRSDRQRTDLVLVGRNVAGDINAELTYGNFDPFFEAALCGTWTSLAGTVADGVTTNASPTVTSATAAFTADDLFKPISGTGIPASSYIGVINSATSIGLSSSPTANTPVNATASATGLTLTLGSVGVPRSAYLRNGTTNRSFLIEKGFLDVADYLSYRGCAINTLGLDVTSRAIVKLMLGIMGTRGYAATSSVAGTTTPTEPNSNQVISAGPLIQLFNSGGSNIEINGIATKEVKLAINNNLRIRDVATAYESGDFGRGVMEITGSLNAYFENLTVYNGFVANSLFSVRYTLTDPLDQRLSYRITLPKVKINDATPMIGGVDSDVMLPITFRALLDDGVGYSINVERNITIIPA